MINLAFRQGGPIFDLPDWLCIMTHEKGKMSRSTGQSVCPDEIQNEE